MKRLSAVVLCAALVLSSSACRRQAAEPTLGPHDGFDMPPVERARVAVGAQAPDFTLENVDGRRVTLSGLRGRFVVLVFYRGHW